MQSMRVHSPDEFNGDRHVRLGLGKLRWLMIGFHDDHAATLGPIREQIKELNWAKYFIFMTGKCKEIATEDVDITDEVRHHFRSGAVSVDLSSCRLYVISPLGSLKYEAHCWIRLTPDN